MTYLEAVNYLLSQVGSAPVDNINSLLPNVVTAKSRLDEQLRSVQKTSWWFNVEVDYPVPLNSVNELQVPSNTQSIISSSNANVILRGNRLYDRVNHTYKFTDAVTCTLIMSLDWDFLPVQAKDVILYRAAIDHIIQELEDYNKAEFIRNSFLYDAMLELKKAELETTRRNHFATPNVAVHRFGVRPYSRGNMRPITRR